MLERREGLKDLQIEILDKFYVALELIPLPILEQFPKFDRDSFKKLQGLYRHVKAKLRLMQTKLSKLQKEDEKDLSISSGTPESVSNSNERPISHISESCLINDDIDTSITSISKAIDFHENLTNVIESHTKEHDSNIKSLIKSPETTIPSKKSTFQLKRPIKTVLGTEISKTIAEMWEKDQQVSKTMNSSNDSEYVPISTKDTFNDNIKTPTKTETNMSMQKNIRNSPNNWINTTNKSQSKANNK